MSLRRVWGYLRAMYPLGERFIQSAGMFVSFYVFMLVVNGAEMLIIGVEHGLVIATTFLSLLALRIADEFKDKYVDRRLFPQRPYPSGMVKTVDLTGLLLLAVLLAVLINVYALNVTSYFLAFALYALAMSLWFGLRKYIQPNLLLALATHNPIYLLLMLYYTAFVSQLYGFEMYTPVNVGVVAGFYLSALIWELGRKIRAPQDETEYVTYSSIFSQARATWLVVGFAGLQLAIFLVTLGLVFWVASAALMLAFITLIYFARQYLSREQPPIAEAVERYLFTVNTIVLVLGIIVFWGRIVIV